MTCRHCGQPVERCPQPCTTGLNPGPCRGWRHGDGWHYCGITGPGLAMAEPEPGALPLTETPTTKPGQEVA